MVSFGVAPVTQERSMAKSSPKIVSVTPSLPTTCIAAGVNSIVPSALRN